MHLKLTIKAIKPEADVGRPLRDFARLWHQLGVLQTEGQVQWRPFLT